MKKALGLFWYFFRVGWFTFGGGWSIVAQIQKDYAEDKKEIEVQELLDIVSVGRSLPGTMIGNVAYLFGYHQGGVIGGIFSVLGMISPPLIILSVFTIFYTNLKDNIWIARALVGVRAAVAPVILSAVLKLHKGAFPVKLCYILCGISCLLSLYFSVSPILLVVFGILAGLLIKYEKGGAAS